MKYIKTFEKFAEQDNCKGCGAALDPKKDKCEFCGSPYKVMEPEIVANPKIGKGSSRKNIKSKYWDDFRERRLKELLSDN